MADDLNALLERSGGGGSLPAPVLINPLAAIATGQKLASGEYELRGLQAKEAAGRAYQGAINPQTGEFDPNRLRTLLSENPTAAMAAGDTLLNTQQLSSNQLEQNLKKATFVNARAGAALESGDYSDGAMLRIFQDGIAGGMLTLPEVQRQMQLLPPDAAGRERWLREHQMSSASVQQQLEQTYGKPLQINRGGSITGGTQNPRTGAISTTGQPVVLGLTPEQQAQEVEVPDNDKTLPDGSPNPNYGKTKKITRGDQLRAAGIDPDNVGGATPGASPLGTGRPPDSLRKPGATPATPATPVTPQPRTLSTTQSPADQELIKQSGPKFQGVIDLGNEQNTTLATLSGMQSDINRFTTGSGAAKTLDWKRAVQSWAPGLARMTGIKSDEIAAQENFQKAVNLIVAQQSRGTDKGMDVQMGATPHDTLSPEGADSIIRQLQGNADYLQARAKLAQAYPNRGDYGGFQAKVADLDPRYFQYERLAPEQKTAYFNGLPEKERDAFKQAYAKTKGMLGGG